ncbi:MAG: protein kinase [Candidatus Aminicenantes bacterium]|nr:protein kinase [Candidatus Aminicenantes bacterium]
MGDAPTRTLRISSVEVQTGQTIAGKFRIIRKLGRGGMGVVYEAEDLHLHRPVALKFLPAGLTADPEARERFVNEARAASGLDHPNICTIHDVDETEDGGLYIAMACYPGETLKERIARSALEPAEAVRIAAEIAGGLAKAHEHGIIHRDIKPGNIMVTTDGLVKILDFGLAKLAGEARLTQPGTTVGTVAYMSPEQARGDDVDARTDLWSLGVILYEMTAGTLPFGRDSERAILHAIVHEEPRAVKNIRPGFPAEIGGVIRKALAKDPGRRYKTAAEMAADLRRLEEAMGAHAHPMAKRLSFRHRPKPVWIAAGAVSLAAVAVAVWLLGKPGLAFENRDKLMVADVENLTGDPVFDLALRTAIEADLQQSPYVAIFDKPQIGETLKLMRKDAATKIDETLGYDVCRFGGVRAFVLPRILSAGDAYQLEAILIDPVKHRHIDRIRVTARGREEVLLKAIDVLSDKLRSHLGESLKSIEKANRPVTEVTTSSWDALNSFSLGQARWQDGKVQDAAKFFELAIEKDPQFVEAHASLGLVLIQFLRQEEKGREMLGRALKLAEAQDYPTRDLLKLKAVNRQFVDKDPQRALEEYRTLREVYPDHMPAWNNSGRILQSLGRLDEAAAMYEKAAELAPHNSIPLLNLWYLYYYYKKDVQAAERTARRYAAMASDLANSHALLGFCLSVQEKFTEGEKELRRAVELEPAHPYALPNLAHMLLASGKAAEAVPIYKKVAELGREGGMKGDPEVNSFDLAMALAASGSRDEAVKLAAGAEASVLKEHGPGKPDAGAFICLLGKLCAIEGKKSEALAYLDRALAAKAVDGDSLVDLAGLYAGLGQVKPAVAALKAALDKGLSDPLFPVILPEFLPIRTSPEFRALFKLGN